MIQQVHLKAPDNWINDPNGFIYYKGQYHLFYQYFPYEPRWGTMHWGHAVSKDLLTWEHRGIALFPSRYEDANGCFSGSAVEKDGKLYLFYTGVHYKKEDPKDIHVALDGDFEAAQLMITSEDGFTFHNITDKKVIIPPIVDPAIGDRTNTRDPKVFRGKKGWYMVLGSTIKNKKGEVLIYQSQDLSQWEYVNQAYKEKDLGWMWECPDYVETPGGNVFIFSPLGLMQDQMREDSQAVCVLADFCEETCELDISDEYRFFDYGLDLYAPQSTTDQDGNRVIIAWLRMPKPVDGKWSGMFCLPRLVEVKKGHIYFPVHPSVKKHFSKEIPTLEEADENGFRILTSLEEGEEISIGGYRIYREGNHICTDRKDVFPAIDGYRMQFQTPELKDGYDLDIYVDEHLVEVYVNDGEYVISNCVYGLEKKILAGDEKRLKVYTINHGNESEFYWWPC
ncbi:MAG: glycoside hydrolase family 32 protein [Lachnospiraceae bacterium]|nr:glycoside hydrolase family 32 protein [Lachnospiraceae bacterium]